MIYPDWNWKLIAGRGKLGDRNWGADFTRPLGELQSELVELRAHKGEVVLLTGGGGSGAHLCVLKDALLTTVGDSSKHAVKVMLEHVTPSMGMRGSRFDPYIDSWQISVAKQG